MRLPLEIAARDIELIPPVRLEIESRAGKLDQFYDRIMRCRVTVEGPGRHHLQGSCAIRLDITVPGKEIVISRQSGEDLVEAIKETFSAAKRKIEDHIRRSRRMVKTHEGPPQARVSKLFPEKGYGFLETADGREIYFHRNSVIGVGFDRLKPGTLVRYSEELGEKGPQASTVAVLKRRISTSRRQAGQSQDKGR
jgi:cold shock CspA family protein